MNPWSEHPVPPIRREAVGGDRIVRCFVERPPSVHALWARALQHRADHDALVADERRWTYRQADAEIARLASGLAGSGLARGDRALLLVGNRPEFVFVFFALQRIGAIAVPVGVREQRPGLAWIARQCGARAIVFDAELADRVPHADEAPALALRVAIESPSVAAPADATALGDVAERGRSAPLAPSAATPVQERDTAVILYTSGTTGNPKGAMLTHFNVAHSVLHYQAAMRLVPEDRSALAVPASHVTGLVAIVASMAHVGGTVVIVREFKAPEFVRLMAHERITHTLIVPAMYQLCLLAPGFAEADLSAWRIGGYGGAPMPVATIDALAERLPALVLVNAYGATETTSPTTVMPPGRTRAHADTVGVALPCAEIVVVDDDGRELPAGAVGELWIGGPMVVPGYWDNPEATAASFTGGLWHSGDLGSVDAEGYVRIVDRKKDMLNRGGYKIYSVEVENVLMAFPGIVEAAVVGRPCPVLGERVHAVLHAPGVAHDDEGVRAHCRSHLADYKVPETIAWSDAPLPRNANGKVMKRLLRAPPADSR